MIYLAAPYTDPNPEVCEQRMALFAIADARLIAKGYYTVSPLAKHWLTQYTTMDTTWQYWKEYAQQLMSKCDELFVVTLDGWDTSTGVQEEIEMAKKFNIPISFVKISGKDIIITDKV